MRSTRIDVPQIALAAFCRENGIARLSFFGSVLREDFSSESDVDILVEFLPGHVPGLRFFHMQTELSGLLGRPVDLHTPGFLSPLFRDRVLSEAEIQYEAA
jgi:uncharacterized protein